MAKFLYLYIVEGRGHFPLDMLRRDSAWPASSDAVNNMVFIKEEANDLRRVEMASHAEPTAARWESFGWRIATQRKMKR